MPSIVLIGSGLVTAIVLLPWVLHEIPSASSSVQRSSNRIAWDIPSHWSHPPFQNIHIIHHHFFLWLREKICIKNSKRSNSKFYCVQSLLNGCVNDAKSRNLCWTEQPLYVSLDHTMDKTNEGECEQNENPEKQNLESLDTNLCTCLSRLHQVPHSCHIYFSCTCLEHTYNLYKDCLEHIAKMRLICLMAWLYNISISKKKIVTERDTTAEHCWELCKN